MNRTVSRFLLASLCGLALSGGAVRAEIVGTDEAAATAPADPAAERARVRAYMERPDVAKQLQKEGVSPGQAEARVRAMSDAEVHAVAQKLDALPAGGRISNTELVIIILLAVIILIIVL
jgi:uncharacterized protein DUF6627